MLSTKGEIIIELRSIRAAMRLSSPPLKARDLAQALYDGFELATDLIEILLLDALAALARAVVQEERARGRSHAYASGRAGEISRGTREFPEFDEICRECPRNYALPGEDDPADTVYVETFEYDFTRLRAGFIYLRQHGNTELRHAAALENLWTLCTRLKGEVGETPREILRRHSYDPGC
jgi:hypothetical protein